MQAVHRPVNMDLGKGGIFMKELKTWQTKQYKASFTLGRYG